MARPRKVSYAVVVSTYQRLRSSRLAAKKLGISDSQVREIVRQHGCSLPRGHSMQPVRL